MTSWSVKRFGPEHSWWLPGYNKWGKLVAKHIVKRTNWGKDLMQAFYDYHVENKGYTWKTAAAQAIIFPGAFVCGHVWTKAPTSFRLANEEEI